MARQAAAKNSAATPRASPAPERAPVKHHPGHKVRKTNDYSSEGVDDNDVFLLPFSDYQVTFAITVLAAAVRLFRIYQPTSVVFDEVQSVLIPDLQ
jgi:dolichyl-phosphate-mannose-protein mannosyltransferase